MEDIKRPLILIVEDVESNYLYLHAVLSKLDAIIEWVKNGVEAVDFVRKNPQTKMVMMLPVKSRNSIQK
jgi:CheY-like chemotaxis protein